MSKTTKLFVPENLIAGAGHIDRAAVAQRDYAVDQEFSCPGCQRDFAGVGDRANELQRSPHTFTKPSFVRFSKVLGKLPSSVLAMVSITPPWLVVSVPPLIDACSRKTVAPFVAAIVPLTL